MSPPKQGRNQSCSCGSGKKFKKCHGSPNWVYETGMSAIMPNHLRPVNPSNVVGRSWLMHVYSHAPRSLDLLLRSAQDSKLRASRIGSNVYLDWEGLRPRMNYFTATHVAERFLPIVNGIMSIRFPVFTNLTLRSITGTQDNGQQFSAPWIDFVASTDKQIDEADYFIKNGGPTIGVWHDLALREPAVSEALLYFGRGGEAFFDLYKAYEVVRDTVGGEKNIIARGFATKEDCDRFTQTANNPKLIGVFARHSRGEPTTKITNPMQPLQARQFIRELLTKWINSLDVDSSEYAAVDRAG